MNPWEENWDKGEPQSAKATPVRDDTVVVEAPWQGYEPKPEMTTLQKVARQIGLTARQGIEGVVRAGEVVLGPSISEANRMLRSNGASYQFPSPSEYVSQKLTDAGFPTEDNPTERVVGAINRGAAGAAGSIGMASGLAPTSETGLRLKSLLLERQPSQIIAGGSGAGSTQVARENGAGPVGQFAAGVAGAAAPGLLFDAARGGVRLFFRGTDADKAQQTFNTYEQAGTTPNATQVGGQRRARALGAATKKTPFSAGVMAQDAERQQRQIGSKVAQVADDLQPNADAAMAGRRIESAVTNKFIPEFKAKAGQLYDKVDAYIPTDKPVGVSNTKKALDDLAELIPGAEETSKAFRNGRLLQIKTALDTDLKNSADGQIPYLAVKKLRTLVGDLASDTSLVNDIPRSQIKKVYAALTQDMQAAAKEAGPEATAALARANKHWSAGLDRIDSLGAVVGARDHESIYKAAIAGSQDGGTRLAQVMRSIPEKDRNTVTSVVVKGLGRATNANQNEAGDVFSTQTFLTNWNKLAPLAKKQVFADDATRKAMDAVAKTASDIKDTAGVYANPSKSGDIMVAGAWGSAVLAPLLTGHPGIAAAAAGVQGAAYGGAKLMASPRFVRWLAISSKAPTNQVPILLNQLREMASSPEERADFEAYAKDVLSKIGKQQK